MPEQIPPLSPSCLMPAWHGLCRRLNGMRLDENGWWHRLVSDREAVFRVDESEIAMRLHGNVFAEIGLRDGTPQCRIEPEHLLLGHPGARTVLDDGEGDVRHVRSLSELAARYSHVRRRVCRHTDRRQAILDRLFLRHSCVLAVDAPCPPGRIDLVALSPQGTAVFFLLRRYADGDLRLKGRGGIPWRMAEADRWLADTAAAGAWVRGLLERSSALETRHSRRYRMPGTITVHPFTRLLVVDFDHAQRLGGLPSLRASLEDGLDRSAARSDIHCLGDAGNISYGTFFSGI